MAAKLAANLANRSADTLRFARPLALVCASALACDGCVEPDQYLPPGQAGSPAGELEGTVTYAGPLPCTEGGAIVGAAVLEVFDTRLLPPPDGLGTTAASLAAVGGDELFAGVRDQLTFNDDGSRWCPADTAAPVTVSASWAAGPLPGGEYEVRGFYDRDGNFNPLIGVLRVPTKGDVGGGAIENSAAVLQGAAPVYRRVAVGQQQGGVWEVPAEGVSIPGIAVTLGLPLPLDVPIFHVAAVDYSKSVCKNGVVEPAPAQPADPGHPSMPADYTLPVFSADPAQAAATEDSLVRLVLESGVAAAEVAAASQPPFGFAVDPPRPFVFTWQDANGDGSLDIGGDHVPDSAVIPSLFPLGIFTKLGDAGGQASPVVLIQGLTLYKSLLLTAGWGLSPQPDVMRADTQVVVGVRPAVICVDPLDASKRAKLVVTHKEDCGGNPVLPDEAAMRAGLKKQLGREVDIVEACLPRGTYAMNLVYPTGQAWTVPNEAGVCQPLEPTSDGGKTCGDPTTSATRARLASQSVVFTISAPTDPSFCTGAHATPPECCPGGKCAAQ
jgi:hypothetical protein